MARTRPAVDPVKVQILTEIGEEMIEKLKEADKTFEVEGTPKATVKKEDGEFRQRPLLPGMVFIPEYAYVATKGQIIIGMSPEDAQEYAFIEMDLRDLDTYFPLMGGEVAPLFGRTGENLRTIVDDIFQERLTVATRSKEEKDQELAETYRDHANFGRF